MSTYTTYYMNVENILKENVFYFQIVYYLGDSNTVKILEIPNCSSLCEFSRYQELIKNVIPAENELECCDNGLEHCSLAF